MIKGEKVYLRELELDDVETLYRWENDTDNWRISDTRSPFSRHLLQRYVETFQDIYTEKQLRLMICSPEKEDPVGAIDLFDYDPKHRRAGVGILIASDEDRRQGYASDALRALIDYGFEVLDLHQLYCSIMVDNEKSLRLFRKFGFEITGELKQWVRDGKGWQDEYFLQLIAPEP